MSARSKAMERNLKREIIIKEYDPKNQMPRDATVLIMGKRRSGKTWLLRQLMYDLQMRRASIMHGTQDGGAFISSFFLDSYIFEGFREEIIKNFMKWQEIQVMRWQEDNTLDIEGCFAFDDLSFDSEIMNNKTLKQCYSNGRNGHYMCIMLAQYLKELLLENRLNTDVAMCFYDPSPANRKKVYDELGGIFGQPKIFNEYYEILSANRCVMVLDNSHSSPKIEERVFWYRADPDLPKFIVGDELYQLYHHLFYNEIRLQKRLEMQGMMESIKKMNALKDQALLDDMEQEKKRKAKGKGKGKSKRRVGSDEDFDEDFGAADEPGPVPVPELKRSNEVSVHEMQEGKGGATIVRLVKRNQPSVMLGGGGNKSLEAAVGSASSNMTLEME